MIRNRRIGHIGIATNDVERDVEWYVDVLGFEVTGKFQNGNDTVYFLKNDDVVFEIFPSDSRLPDEVSGRIDHYSFASDDIESDYAYCVENGYKIVTDGIEGIAGFWDNGIRYFKIASCDNIRIRNRKPLILNWQQSMLQWHGGSTCYLDCRMIKSEYIGV